MLSLVNTSLLLCDTLVTVKCIVIKFVQHSPKFWFSDIKVGFKLNVDEKRGEEEAIGCPGLG